MLQQTSLSPQYPVGDGEAERCAALRDLRLPDVAIRSAQVTPAGGFASLGALRTPDLPAFCREMLAVLEQQ